MDPGSIGHTEWQHFVNLLIRSQLRISSSCYEVLSNLSRAYHTYMPATIHRTLSSTSEMISSLRSLLLMVDHKFPAIASDLTHDGSATSLHLQAAEPEGRD